MRARVAPPTATQRAAVGQSTAVSGNGTYADVDSLNVAPPSRLWATAPLPTAGLPVHVVPTSAHTRVEGQATP
jgi:hypothetical protein